MNEQTGSPSFADIAEVRFSRRRLLGGAAAATLAALPAIVRAAPGKPSPPPFRFAEIEHGVDATHHVAPGHEVQILLRWGDPVLPGAPPFDPMRQTAAAQEKQFGYNNDYIGQIVLPVGADGRQRALLCVNHEYSIAPLMFPGMRFNANGQFESESLTADHCEIEKAAHGISIVEIERHDTGWRPVIGRYNRRLTARTPGYLLSGPAAGHPRLRTGADPHARSVIGTLNNCAGGVTPWGSYLAAEENIDDYFGGTLVTGHPEAANHAAMGVPGEMYGWWRFDKRFDIGHEPNEPNRFGWIVEIDALDPTAPPRKRTALGRFCHEGAETIIAPDGRLVVYSGDDSVFQHLYRFVSRDRVDLTDRAANRNLLDHGTLYAARFDADGSLTWLPLVHGTGPLVAANGFASQADVLIEARRAARLLGATPMDRPEDVQPHPTNGRVYLMLTNNGQREPDQVDAANPRANNAYGHIIELQAPDGDHTAGRFTWDMLVRCGLPETEGFETGAEWNPKTSANGWFASPDNCAVDPMGRLWIATDQGSKWSNSGTADGLWALGTDGDERGLGRMFFRVPIGAEMCGPCFASDGRTFFASVQHPGADGTANWSEFGRTSTFADPATRWPDFQPDMPPRPSVVAIRRSDGGAIGA